VASGPGESRLPGPGKPPAGSTSGTTGKAGDLVFAVRLRGSEPLRIGAPNSALVRSRRGSGRARGRNHSLIDTTRTTARDFFRARTKNIQIALTLHLRF
jgi:hypothetical protein